MAAPNGLTNVVSTNGGATWTLAAGQPRFTICAGAQPGSPGYFDRATDPWVSFSADGQVAYSISDSFNANGPAFGGASSGTTFKAFFDMSQPVATAGQSDTFSNSAG
jgi:hypothetical protein